MDNVAVSVTVDDLVRQMAEIKQFRAEYDLHSQAQKIRASKIELAEHRMIELLELSGLKNFKGPDGLAYISYRTSVKTPKSPEDRAAFFEYLKSKGLYDQMITVNSQTLNSFYKAEIEEAKTRGDADFEIPGIHEVTVEPSLGLRKA